VAYSSLHVPFVTWNLDHYAGSKRGALDAQCRDATFQRTLSSTTLSQKLKKKKNSPFSLSLFGMIHEVVERLRLFLLNVSSQLRDPWYHNPDNHNIGLTLYGSDNRRSVVIFFCSTALELADCRHYIFVSHVAARARRSDIFYTIILPWSPDCVLKRMFDDIFWVITSSIVIINTATLSSLEIVPTHLTSKEKLFHVSVPLSNTKFWLLY